MKHEDVALTRNQNTHTHTLAHHYSPHKMASGRLTHQHMDDLDSMPATKKRKGASTRVERPRGVAAQFRQTDVSDVQEVCVGRWVGGEGGRGGGGGGGEGGEERLLDLRMWQIMTLMYSTGQE